MNTPQASNFNRTMMILVCIVALGGAAVIGMVKTLDRSSVQSSAGSARSAASAPQVHQIDFDLLAAVKYDEWLNRPSSTKPNDPIIKPDDSQIPADVKALDGQMVEISGFVIPIATDDGKTSEFVLTWMVPGCFFCQPPNLSEFIMVHLPKDKALAMNNNDTATVKGKLRVGAQMDGRIVTSIYQIDDATYIPGGL